MIEPNAIAWKRLIAEAAAIVVSILLAFSIDAWWETRQDRVEEHEILIGLEAEFVDLKERLDYWGGMNRTGIQLTTQFLSDDMTDMNRESLENVFIYTSLANVLDQGGALDALLASGRLELIADRDIRLRLAKWPDWLEDMHTNDLSIREFAWNQIMTFLARHGIPRDACDNGELVCPTGDDIPAVYLQLAANPEFRSLLTMRRTMMFFAANDHESASREADEILVMIRSSLGDRGLD